MRSIAPPHLALPHLKGRSTGRLAALALVFVLGACSLYTGNHSEQGSGSGNGSGGAGYTLTVDRTIGAEGVVAGVDADQQGGLWIAYAPDISCTVNGTVTVVHWDPTTRETLATFTYMDSPGSASGLALVNGQIWLNRILPCNTAAAEIQIIDPTTGDIVGTAPPSEGTAELAAVGSNEVLYSDVFDTVYTVDTATDGYVSTFSTDFNPSSTQKGIAWRPGEIWVSGWTTATASVFDESGSLLGSAPFPSVIGLPVESAADTQALAFDRGQLLVAMDSQLTWLDVASPDQGE
jgi:hypothetical protein